MGKFRHLDVPRQWTETFTKYPHGLTIFEALVDWTSQVDKMVDNVNDWNEYLDGFVDNFEFELQEEVKATISKWQDEGLLDDIISAALDTELDNVNTQMTESRKYEVYSENDLAEIVSVGGSTAVLKNNIVISEPVNLDRFSFELNLNGFTIKLSDDYEADHVFRVGETEYSDFYSKYHKWFFNGVIDMNDRPAHVFNYTFSWSFQCKDLRVINARRGFIFYTTSEGQVTRGAEALLENVSIIGSDNVEPDSIAFDWWIGDSFLSGLYSHYFAIGLKNRVGGIHVRNSHFWGLPHTSNQVNKIMKIGVWNRGYYNVYNNVIVDTPERVNQLEPASLSNGGIGFYDEYSAAVIYNDCDILCHAATENQSLYGFYFNKPDELEDKWYGQSVTISNCFSRNSGKFMEGIHFTGVARNLNIVNTGLRLNAPGNARGYGRVTSNMTVYKKDTNIYEGEGISYFSLCNGPNEFQMINDDYGIDIMFRDKDNNAMYARINENFQNVYTPSGLQTLADDLKNRQSVTGQASRMSQIFVTKYDSTVAVGEVGRYDLCFWSTGLKAFYNFRTGEQETN